MTINANFPAIRPSLNLDFANSRALDPRITFARASSAMYYDDMGKYRQAATNEARFDHDPVTGECKGLLIEESRTNLLTYSEQFDNAAWGRVGATISPNTTTAPDGTVTADKLIEDTTTGGHKVTQQVTFGTGWVSFSVRAKAAERSKLRLYLTDLVSAVCAADIDLLTCEVIGSTFQTPWAGGFASIRNLGDGWCECVLAAPATQGVTKKAEIRAIYASGVDSYTGDGISGIYIWGAQLEAGAFPTSYIPTTSAQATRAADIAQMTGANFSWWFNPSEGTIASEWWLGYDTVSAQVYSINNGSGSSMIRCRYGSSGTSNDNAVTIADVVSAGLGLSTQQIQNTKYRNAMAYAANDFARSADGANVVVDTSGALPVVTMLGIGGAGYGSSENLNGHIARLTYYPKRLPNALLQELSR